MHNCPFVYCGHVATDWNALVEHFSRVHDRVLCTEEGCASHFQVRSGFTDHFRVVHAGMRFRCPRCDREFKTRSGRSKHMRHLPPCSGVEQKPSTSSAGGMSVQLAGPSGQSNVGPISVPQSVPFVLPALPTFSPPQGMISPIGSTPRRAVDDYGLFGSISSSSESGSHHTGPPENMNGVKCPFCSVVVPDTRRLMIHLLENHYP